MLPPFCPTKHALNRRASSQIRGAKTDAIDAYLLARTRRSAFADLQHLRPDTALIQELKTLTRDQESLMVSQTRLVNQLTACLKTYYPVWVLSQQVQSASRVQH